MVRTHTSHNPAGLENRGRPRERERRTAGAAKERSRERDFGRTTARKSRSPARTKPALTRSAPSTITSSSRQQEFGRRPDQAPRVDRRNDRDKSRDRNQLPTPSSKLRMDRDRNRDRDKDYKIGNSEKDVQASRKRLGELDRAVKRAREERSSYWNKRVLEAEEKDPNRWGHSGFKELYRRDMKLGTHGRSDYQAASASSTKTLRRSSPERQRGLLQQQDSARSVPARGRSRSKSPRSKTKQRSGRHSSSPFSQRSPGAPRPLLGNNRRTSPFLDDLSESKRAQDRRRNNERSNMLSERRSYSDAVTASKSGSRNIEDKISGTDSFQGWSEKRGNTRLHRKSPSDSLSRSRTRSSMSPPAKMKRSSNPSSKVDPKGKDSWGRASNMDTSKNRSRSRSPPSSSSTSEDEDVLELHAKSRRKGSSISSHSSSSSSDDSKSNSSSSSAESSKRRNASGSSSSTSSSESDSDDDSDVSGKIESRKKPSSSRLYNKDATKPGSKGKTEESRVATKRQIAGSSAVSSKVPRKSTAPKDTRNNEKFAAGDSESDSGSSSDSDSEPRMTLSERFAKLTQMSTDKREFAKPVLAMNEIDTKLKVVKDLRNADVKIYVDGLQQRNESSLSTKARPKSPDYNNEEGEKRYSSDERRRHFERMARDEPRERPADWSDSRVRYEYYRDRGYFNDRPLTFDEYVKWEQWWYEYRDWLETEGYYPRSDNSAPRGNHGHGQFLGSSDGPSRGSRSGDWNQPSTGMSSRMRPGQGQPPPRSNPISRRVEQVPVRMIPLSSRTHFMGRTDGRGPGPAHGSLQGRSIDRIPGGSLIVNIRQGNNYGPRGRHVGLIRGRQR